MRPELSPTRQTFLPPAAAMGARRRPRVSLLCMAESISLTLTRADAPPSVWYDEPSSLQASAPMSAFKYSSGCAFFPMKQLSSIATYKICSGKLVQRMAGVDQIVCRNSKVPHSLLLSSLSLHAKVDYTRAIAREKFSSRCIIYRPQYE